MRFEERIFRNFLSKTQHSSFPNRRITLWTNRLRIHIVSGFVLHKRDSHNFHHVLSLRCGKILRGEGKPSLRDLQVCRSLAKLFLQFLENFVTTKINDTTEYLAFFLLKYNTSHRTYLSNSQ